MSRAPRRRAVTQRLAVDSEDDRPTVRSDGVHRRSAERPVPLSPTVSAQMSRMPTRGTEPEWRLRRLLHARGLRYKLHRRDLPGRPDIVFARARLVIFVDGCFWHQCPDHGVLPKNNREWWRTKLDGNVARDRSKDKALVALGWRVVRVWEHEDPEAIAAYVAGLVRRASADDARIP